MSPLLTVCTVSATADACVLNVCHLTLYRMESLRYIWPVKKVTVNLFRHC